MGKRWSAILLCLGLLLACGCNFKMGKEVAEKNLDTELCRRIVDFLSGATYANHGNMRKVSRGTFLIVPHGVDMMGELMLEDFEENKMYF